MWSRVKLELHLDNKFSWVNQAEDLDGSSEIGRGSFYDLLNSAMSTIKNIALRFSLPLHKLRTLLFAIESYTCIVSFLPCIFREKIGGRSDDAVLWNNHSEEDKDLSDRHRIYLQRRCSIATFTLNATLPINLSNLLSSLYSRTRLPNYLWF